MKNTSAYLRYLPAMITVVIIAALRFADAGSFQSRRCPGCAELPGDLSAGKLFGQTVFLEQNAEASGIMKAYDTSGSLLGYLVSTSEYAGHIKGYAGPTPILIAISREGTITGTRLLKNSETPAFDSLVRSSPLLEDLHGTHWKDAAFKDIDAVSGATFTSKAVTATVKHTLSRLELDDAGLKSDTKIASEKGSPEKHAGTPSDKQTRPDAGGVFTALVALCAFFAATTSLRKIRGIRTFILLISLIWLGFIRGELISADLISKWTVRGMFTGASAGLLFTAVLSVLTAAVKGKPLYCGYLCPFGALQEFINKYSPWKIRLPRKTFIFLSRLRYFLLFYIAVSLFFFPSMDLTETEPFTMFAFPSASAAVLLIAGVSLGLSLFLFRPWCSFLCPTGAFFEIFRKNSPIVPGKGYSEKPPCACSAPPIRKIE
jgi:uncharacterized protein with FMN-binding domain